MYLLSLNWSVFCFTTIVYFFDLQRLFFRFRWVHSIASRPSFRSAANTKIDSISFRFSLVYRSRRRWGTPTRRPRKKSGPNASRRARAAATDRRTSRTRRRAAAEAAAGVAAGPTFHSRATKKRTFFLFFFVGNQATQAQSARDTIGTLRSIWIDTNENFLKDLLGAVY